MVDEIKQVPVKGRNAPAPDEGVEPEAADEESEEAAIAHQEESAAKLLGELTKLRRGRMTKERADKAIADLRSAMTELDDDYFRVLTNSEEFQDLISRATNVSGGKPGDPIFDERGREIDRVPLSYAYLCEIMPMQTWVPPRTEIISYNGVDCRVIEGIPNTAPICFYTQQMDAINAERRNAREQELAISESGLRWADGVTHTVGWAPKPQTAEEYLNIPGWGET